jgi:2-haloacid dehalogenase
MPLPAPPEALLFDIFGTVVDWRSSIIAELATFAQARGLTGDWAAFADQWRSLYQPSMEDVRSGRRVWTILDVLHRESLDTLLVSHNLTTLSDADRDHLTKVWHRLQPWPDVVSGLTRLKSKFIIGTLSNGNVGLLTRMGKNAKLPWDVVLGAETARAYKPLPEAYRAAARLLNVTTDRVMLVAAHNDDLAGAAQEGMQTAFIGRPTEHGPSQKKDFEATGPWTYVATDFGALATQLGCA